MPQFSVTLRSTPLYSKTILFCYYHMYRTLTNPKLHIYLFGSYANNTFTNESDLDLYIVVKDDVVDIPAETARAYKAIRRVKWKLKPKQRLCMK